MAFATVVVDVTAPPVPFFTEPLFKVPLTPDSFASGQPSPSLSKSNRFGIPSPSESISVQLNCAGRVASVKIILVNEDAK